MKLNLLAQELTITASADDGTPKRTIEGIAVPWNVEATVSDGTRVRFLPGSLPEDGPAPKLIRDHDLSKPVGIVAERASADSGMLFSARVSATRDGDEALTLAADGVLDAVSVGVEPTDYSWDGDVLVVAAANWRELSLVPFGAFPEARVVSVAASEPEPKPTEPSEGEPEMSDNPIVEAASVPTAPLFVSAPRKVSAAEYVSAAVTGNAKLIEAANNGTADVPGILPEPLVGEVFDTLNDRRPFVSAVGTLAAPSVEVWNRRRITQHTDVDVQAAQFDDLASQALEIEKIPVNNQLVGGFIDLSEQVIDWSDPSMVNLVLRDMTRVYAKRTETLACAALVAGVTADEEITDWTDGDEVLDALYDASATIDAAIDELPTALMLSPDRWASLGKMKNANGDRIFVQVGPSNAGGTMNPGSFEVAGLGLRAIVSNKFAAGTFIVGNPVGIELYEARKGLVRVDQPANASVRLAVRGYFASLVIEPGAFVKFVDPA